MSTDFRELLARTAVARGLSLRALALRAGMDPSFLNRVRHGERPLPVDRIDHLAAALGLEGRERETFIEQAHLSMVPDYIRRLVDELRHELHCCRQELAALATQRRRTRN